MRSLYRMAPTAFAAPGIIFLIIFLGHRRRSDCSRWLDLRGPFGMPLMPLLPAPTEPAGGVVEVPTVGDVVP